MLLAKYLMADTKIMVPETTSIVKLTGLLRKHRIAGLPVMDKSGKFSGVVTVGHIFGAIEIIRKMRHQKPNWLSLFNVRRDVITIKELYLKERISILPEASVEEIVRLMIETESHAIPVMNKDQTELYGVVGRHDVTWAIFGNEAEVKQLSRLEKKNPNE